MRRTPLLILAAIVAILAALYCFSGYAMNASFSVAAPERHDYYAQRGIIWGVVGLASTVVAVGLLVGAWRSRRHR